MAVLINTKEYFKVLEDVKKRIKTTQYKAVLGANRELMALYWGVGKTILDNTKYGTSFLENLSRDIMLEFPEIKGFSVRNLNYMRKFAEVYPDFSKVQRVVALLPWRIGHCPTLLCARPSALNRMGRSPITYQSYVGSNFQNCVGRPVRDGIGRSPATYQRRATPYVGVPRVSKAEGLEQHPREGGCPWRSR